MKILGNCNFIVKGAFHLVTDHIKSISQTCRHTRHNSSNSNSLNPPSSTDRHSAQYCLELVRRHDYENFLCTLLIKRNSRQSALGIRAFNVEVSKVASAVSDDKIGLIRLKFWQSAIDSIYDQTGNKPIPDHPVIRQLKVIVKRHGLSKLYFSRLIKARERPSNLNFITAKQLEQYAEESSSCTLYLLAKVCGANNVDIDHALSHLGKAQGIVNMLRAQRYQSRSMAICVPQEVLIKHGISQERVLRDRADDKGVQDCIFEVASIAFAHLEKARNLANKIPTADRALLLPSVAVERYLERLRRVNFQLSHSDLIKRDSMLPMAYYWNYFRKKY